MNQEIDSREPSSFRDPSGFVFRRGTIIYRQVNKRYGSTYDRFMKSGLYRSLVDAAVLIPHAETDLSLSPDGQAYAVLLPEQLGFLSYPYEWCFSQLRDAALLTLEIESKALAQGMTLKDASAYNVQFHKGKPLFIDTLSFDLHRVDEPWVGYGQFCRHFLAPLALTYYTGQPLARVMQVYLDGLPLDLASSLLPLKSWLRPSIFVHVHLHAAAQKKLASIPTPRKGGHFSRNAFMGLIDSLATSVKSLRPFRKSSAWSAYYATNTYSESAIKCKEQCLSRFIDRANPRQVWDLGANDGRFSRMCSARSIFAVSIDADHSCVERNYLMAKASLDPCLLPLCIDITNPSPSIGWHLRERGSLLSRGPVDMVLALALVHHLVIAANIPLDRVARFFASICTWLVVEFVPQDDPQVLRIMGSRRDLFDTYCKDSFEHAFGNHFSIIEQVRLPHCGREVYFMKTTGHGQQ